MLLWIPLIITIGVFVVFLGEWHSAAHRYQQLKNVFVPQDYIYFPDVLVWPSNANIQSVSCQQDGSAAFTYNANQPCPHNQSDTSCFVLPLSQKTSRGFDQWSQGIQCTFTFVSAPQQNQILALTTKGGWHSANGWSDDWQTIRPNAWVSVHYEPTVLHINQETATIWAYRHQYFSTWFPYGTTPAGSTYQMNIFFQMPFSAVGAFWESTGFDSWLLCAAWGGGIAFFTYLHVLVFSLLSLLLPRDSRVYGDIVDGSGREFQNIR